MPAGTNTSAHSSQLLWEPAQALCAAGSGPQCWCQKQNQEWESREAQTGRWSSQQATGPVAPLQLPRILMAEVGWQRTELGGGGQREALGILQGDRSRLGLRTHPSGTWTSHPHLEQPRTPGFVQRRLTPSLRHSCLFP